MFSRAFETVTKISLEFVWRCRWQWCYQKANNTFWKMWSSRCKVSMALEKFFEGDWWMLKASQCFVTQQSHLAGSSNFHVTLTTRIIELDSCRSQKLVNSPRSFTIAASNFLFRPITRCAIPIERLNWLKLMFRHLRYNFTTFQLTVYGQTMRLLLLLISFLSLAAFRRNLRVVRFRLIIKQDNPDTEAASLLDNIFFMAVNSLVCRHQERLVKFISWALFFSIAFW